jgi:DNA-binding NtrC family response regulator
MELAAILLAPGGASGPLRDLVARLAAVGVAVTTVDDLDTAVAVAASHRTPPALLLDLCAHGAGDPADLDAATAALRAATARQPGAHPVVLTATADPALILTCVRAGAGDVLDLDLEGTAAARAVVQRSCERQAARAAELAMVATQRDMIEELLKDVILTERRAIDAEEALAAGSRASAGDGRAPAVLLVEHDRALADELADRLEEAGVATFAFLTGEDALREADALAASTGLDLALVATRLRGIDGLETVARLRARIADLPALILVPPEDAAIATRAAALAIGVLAKPLGDLAPIVRQIRQLARDSRHRTREQAYLQRIKERHERVLARYRSLPREP